MIAARAAHAAQLKHYSERYDFALIGYFPLSADGAIRRVNLTRATLVVVPRAALLGQRFGLLLAEADRRPSSASATNSAPGSENRRSPISRMSVGRRAGRNPRNPRGRRRAAIRTSTRE